MFRFVTSFLILQSCSTWAFAQYPSPLVGTGRTTHPGYLEGTSQSLDSMPTDSEAAKLGLEINWLKNSESFQPSIGEPGAILWPDQVDEEVSITLRSGNRVVAVIDARQRNVDYARYGMYQPSNGDKPGPLGIEGAQKVADKIAADYKLLGRDITVEPPSVRPKTYLTVASDRGGVEMFDAESGQKIWKTSLGDGTLPVVGPTVDNEMVAVLIGAKAYILDKSNGKIINSEKLGATVSTMPISVGNLLFVPQVNGMLATHDRNDLISVQASFGFNEALQFPPIASADGTFISWAIGRHLYTAKYDGRMELWSRLETLGKITSTPVEVADGLVAATDDGTVLRLNFDRYNNIKWRENVGFAVLARPMTNESVVLVISAGGDVICLNAETGKVVWSVYVPGVKRPLTISKTKAYFQDLSGGLIAISLDDGHVVGRVVKALADGVRNDYSDRIYLRGRDGRIMCLNEIGHDKPSFHPLVDVMRGKAQPKESKKEEPAEEANTTPDTEMETEPAEAGNPFGAGDSPFGAGSEETSPFGAEGDAASPFGGDAGAADSNPFGS